MLESGLTFDFAQLVLDNEFVRMIKHTIGGLTVDDESLAVNVIKAVGPAKDFLTQPHTLKHLRLHSQPELIDRNRMEKWKSAGATDCYTRATEKTREILQNHQPELLPEKVIADIQSLITETECELGVSNTYP